jgi:hypothetical protein
MPSNHSSTYCYLRVAKNTGNGIIDHRRKKEVAQNVDY